MKISPGDSIGRYHILEPLGEGGMAAVYKAYDTRLEREVAIKFLRTELFGSAVLEQLFKRFEREAKALARLSHFHIVNIYDYGEHEDNPYLVMEYVPGGTLKTRMGKPIPWSDAINLLMPVGRALEYAHQHGVLHRDVKPSNILINESGEPLLSDFGIAKILETTETQAITGTGVGIGTPEYMAPEQGLAETVDARTDVYALGVVLFEMITGRKPYTADTPTAVLIKLIHDPLPNPKAWVNDLPDSVEHVLIKALAKQPENRYASMAEFVRAMEAALKPSPIEKTEEPTVAVDWRPKPKEQPATQVREVVLEKDIKEKDSVAAERVREHAATAKPRRILSLSAIRSLISRYKWIFIGLGAVILAGVVFAGLTILKPVLPMPAMEVGTSDGYILFTSNRDGNAEIYRMTKTGDVIRLTNTPAGGSSTSPNANPQGYIFYVSDQDGQKEIYRLERDSSGARITNSGSSKESINPVYDPNSYLLFCSNRDGKYEIYRMDKEGVISRVTTTPGRFESCEPAVDSSGNLIFTSNREGGKWELYRMGSDGNIARLTDSGGYDSRSPVADPGSYLLFVSNRQDGKNEIYRMKEDGQVIRVTYTPGRAGSTQPAVDKVGNVIFSSNRSGVNEIFRIDLDGTSAQITNSSDGSASWGAIFAP